MQDLNNYRGITLVSCLAKLFTSIINTRLLEWDQRYNFERYFINSNCTSIELQMINMFLIMYADDTVLLAESPEGLQDMLNTLHRYTDEWNLSVNVQKTKIVIFRNGKCVKDNEKWEYNSKYVEVVNQFNYLGMLFNYNGKFLSTQKHCAAQGNKAMFSISSKMKDLNFNVETQLNVFDTYVKSVLSYGAEIWGFHKGQDVESKY